MTYIFISLVDIYIDAAYINVNMVHKYFHQPDKIRARTDCNSSFLSFLSLWHVGSHRQAYNPTKLSIDQRNGPARVNIR
jgi:hypothetical protein